MSGPLLLSALAAIGAAAAATYFWRWLGVLLAGRLNPNSALVSWVGAVAYAMLAGLIARIIVLPIGPLATTSTAARLGATAIAVALFYLTRRNLILGVAAGGVALVLLTQAGA